MSTTTPFVPGLHYHIYNRGNNGENIFLEERNYHYFMKLYTHYIHPIADTFAYCLLRNHFHFLIRIREIDPTSDKTDSRTAPRPSDSSLAPEKRKPPYRHFNNLFIAYTKSINKAYHRTGSLFEKPFRRKLVNKDRYFMRLVIYIHQNPQKHRLTDDFRNWTWSSYQAIIKKTPTHLARETVLEWFGGVDNFIEYHQIEMEEDEIRPFLDDGWE